MEGSESTLSVQGEPQARAMKSLHGAPGYKLQTAVDAHSHLIVHHEVCNDTSDVKQLAPTAHATTQVLDATPTVLADAGYANADHLQLLEQAGQRAFVATLESGNPRGKGSALPYAECAWTAVREFLPECFLAIRAEPLHPAPCHSACQPILHRIGRYVRSVNCAVYCCVDAFSILCCNFEHATCTDWAR